MLPERTLATNARRSARVKSSSTPGGYAPGAAHVLAIPIVETKISGFRISTGDPTVDRMLEYHHVDVFSAEPYAGNSLAVFVDQPPLTGGQMLAITQELRHFESI